MFELWHELIREMIFCFLDSRGWYWLIQNWRRARSWQEWEKRSEKGVKLVTFLFISCHRLYFSETYFLVFFRSRNTNTDSISISFIRLNYWAQLHQIELKLVEFILTNEWPNIYQFLFYRPWKAGSLSLVDNHDSLSLVPNFIGVQTSVVQRIHPEPCTVDFSFSFAQVYFLINIPILRKSTPARIDHFYLVHSGSPCRLMTAMMIMTHRRATHSCKWGRGRKQQIQETNTRNEKKIQAREDEERRKEKGRRRIGKKAEIL